jgi:DMSO/TMAO reductase YedYZ molybdopterin-dependent catalytic subunit
VVPACRQPPAGWQASRMGDLHCVTKWSKLHTTWRGVSLDTLLAQAQTSADARRVSGIRP